MGPNLSLQFFFFLFFIVVFLALSEDEEDGAGSSGYSRGDGKASGERRALRNAFGGSLPVGNTLRGSVAYVRITVVAVANLGGSSGSGGGYYDERMTSAVAVPEEDVEDPFTTLTLAPPGTAAVSGGGVGGFRLSLFD